MSPAVMQSTGQFSLQAPHAMQLSKIFLGIPSHSLSKVAFDCLLQYHFNKQSAFCKHHFVKEG
jgi:hypothetical protein